MRGGHRGTRVRPKTLVKLDAYTRVKGRQTIQNRTTFYEINFYLKIYYLEYTPKFC